MDKEELLPGQMNFIDFLAEYDQEMEVDVRGLLDDGYCPRCDAPMEDLTEVCPWCGQRLSWERWKKLNG